jgi:phage/plasmid-associated DNA primase
VRHELSTTVKDHFILAHSKLKMNQTMDELESQRSNNNTSTANKEINKEINKVLSIALKLQDAGFKDSVIKEMREYFYDGEFLQKLDAKVNLLAFTNGVWDFETMRFRNTVPEDNVSLSVGYAYIPVKDTGKAKLVAEYFEKMHPDPAQRDYVIRTFARQGYGDHGNELFHIHAGHQGSAGNGKTMFFEVCEYTYGDYVRKFPVQILIAKNREEANTPVPEYQYWRGRRILYCTEPKYDDILHSGIMKDLTGGEKVSYRLLFSNDVHKLVPQYKMHIMCNDPPKVDGTDDGVKRRIRKIDYVSRFVDSADVDESKNMYQRDPSFFRLLRESHAMRMEVMRYFLDHFDMKYEYTMPKVVKENSKAYLEDNNNVHRFVTDCIRKCVDSYFTLADAKQMFKSCDYPCDKISTLKCDLEKVLQMKCAEQKKIQGKNIRNAFVGFRLVYPTDEPDILGD